MQESLNIVYKTFSFRQQFALIQNKYEIYEISNNQESLVAYAEQKMFKLKEQIHFYSNSTKNSLLFSIQSRNIFDATTVADVLNSQGKVVGVLRKDFGTSLFRSTWLVLDPQDEGKTLLKVQEHSLFLAILRRIIGFIPLVEYFEYFIRSTFEFLVNGRVVGKYVRTWGLRDQYTMQISEEQLQGIGQETILALGVVLDTLQNR